MIKVEAQTLEEAYQNAASSLECSVTELKIEVVQSPTNGFLGFFKKTAIIVAVQEKTETEKVSDVKDIPKAKEVKKEKEILEDEYTQKEAPKVKKEESKKPVKKEFSKPKKTERKKETRNENKKPVKKESKPQHILSDTIMPASFVSTQDEEEEYDDVSNYLADYDDEEDDSDTKNISEIAATVKNEINTLFEMTCFKIDVIDVSVYNETTLLVEFKGDDAALLIGKEGYRYKALSYMIFNWINTKYQVQLRLEIAEFLKNQEESITKYLVGVCASIDKDGRAQTKILDGVLVQIALKELRDKYPDKYIVIRSTRDGLKYIIVNDYHNN